MYEMQTQAVPHEEWNMYCCHTQLPVKTISATKKHSEVQGSTVICAHGLFQYRTVVDHVCGLLIG